MPTAQAGSSMLVPMILIFLIFYMLVFRPQKKEQQDKQKMRDEIKKNDRVVTAGGIHGTIVLVKEKTVLNHYLSPPYFSTLARFTLIVLRKSGSVSKGAFVE